MKEDLNLDEFFCPNERCADYGKLGKGNIGFKTTYGRHDTTLLVCNICGKRFSENRGTMFFGLHTDREIVLKALAMLVEKGSIRGVARVMELSKDTVCSWLEKAGKHCEEVSDYLIGDLKLTQVQVDEVWTFIKKAKKSEAG